MQQFQVEQGGKGDQVPPPNSLTHTPQAAGHTSSSTSMVGKAVAGAGVAVIGGLSVAGEMEGAFAILGKVATEIPLAGPLGALMGSVLELAVEAKYNKDAAKLLEERTKETLLVLAELLPAVKVAGKSKATEKILINLKATFEKIAEFLKKYAKRSYLSKLLRGHTDSHELENLDHQVTTCLQNLSLSADRANLQLQQKAFKEIDKVAKMIQENGGAQSVQNDPALAQRVAEAVGVPLSDLNDEMQVFFREMRESQHRIENKLEELVQQQAASVEALKRPADPDAFWNKYFDSKQVELDYFIPVFEDEFNDQKELKPAERKTFAFMIDRYPRDGKVSMLEWKRFHRSLMESPLPTHVYLQQAAEAQAEEQGDE